MKKLIFKYLKQFYSIFPLRNVILFESVPDMEGNSRAVFDKMVEQEMNNKYQLVWLVTNPKQFEHIQLKNVRFDSKPIGLFEKIKYTLKYFNAKVKITENACYPKFHNRTLAIHLGHGTAIKNTGTLMHIKNDADYALYQSEFVKDMTMQLHDLKNDQLVCLGYPRNDNLLKGNNIANDEKYIVWLPTFRKSTLLNRVDSSYDFPLGIPIFKSFSEVEQLNAVLKQHRYKLYIKPHFAENLNTWNTVDFSNIKLITDDFYKKKELLFYEFLGMSKALITDYSSVYFDYLLMDKPIGLTMDDLEWYEEGIGFVYGNYKETILGEQINNYTDLESYIIRCVTEEIKIDYLKERKDKFNKFKDKQSAQRVVEFLVEKAHL